MLQMPRFELVVLIALLFPMTPAQAQFTMVIDVPPDIAPFRIGSNTQLNLFDGGTIGNVTFAGDPDVPTENIEVNIYGGTVGLDFEAHIGSTVNISGGLVKNDFKAYSGSTINIFGGYISSGFRANDGSVVNISGGEVAGFLNAQPGSEINVFGSFGVNTIESWYGAVVNINGGRTRFESIGAITNVFGGALATFCEADSNSQVTVYGGEFRLNGNSISGLETIGDSIPFNLLSGDVLSGTLSDGSPFAFSSWSNDDIESGVLTLVAAAVPPVGPSVITASVDPVPFGIRQGQTLVVDNGGVVPSYFTAGPGSAVNLQAGGAVGIFEAVGAVVNVTDGTLDEAYVYAGSEVNVVDGILDSIVAVGGSRVDVSGGSIHYVDVIDGSELIFSGGSITSGFAARSGSTATMFNGSAGNFVRAFPDGMVNIFGGAIGNDFAGAGTVNITGGSFGSRFRAVFGGNIDISGGSFGESFRADAGSEVTMHGGNFRIDGVPIGGLDTVGSSMLVNIPNGSVLSGMFADGTPFAFFQRFQSPIFEDNVAPGVLRLVVAPLPPLGPAVLTIPADEVPMGLRGGQTLIVESGGSVPGNFCADWGSIVQVQAGGILGDNFEAVGAVVDIRGGVIGPNFDALTGSVVKISGGSVGQSFHAYAGSIVTISGGTIDRFFRAEGGSNLNLIGTQFLLNGSPIDGLVPGQPFTLTSRTGTLSGRFADDTEFSLGFVNTHTIAPNAVLTLTLVPEPTTLLLVSCSYGAMVGLRRQRKSAGIARCLGRKKWGGRNGVRNLFVCPAIQGTPILPPVYSNCFQELISLFFRSSF